MLLIMPIFAQSSLLLASLQADRQATKKLKIAESEAMDLPVPGTNFYRNIISNNILRPMILRLKKTTSTVVHIECQIPCQALPCVLERLYSSPTRTYLPVAKALAGALGDHLKGLVHCSGGGQTKCMRFGTGVHHIKDNLFAPPPLFAEIQKVSGTTDEEMHQVYNMGHRFEVYCPPKYASEVIEVSGSFGIEAQVIGRTEPSDRPGKTNHLTIQKGEKTLTYG